VATDVTPPSTPAAPTATVTNGVDVGLTWPAATDNVGVTGYRLHRAPMSGFTVGAATLVGTVVTPSYVDAGRPAGTWYYRVVAFDAANNASTASPETAVAAGGPPTVVTLRPTEDAFVNAGGPGTNYATDPFLKTRGTLGAQSYLRFALPAAPTGQRLTSAVLRLMCDADATADNQSVRIGSDAWTESALTWSNRPGITGALLATMSGVTATTTSSTALSPSALSGLLGTSPTIGITSSGTDQVVFRSNNYGGPTATAAQLAIRPSLTLTFESVGADVQAPAAPGGLTAAVAGGKVTLSWTAATDNLAVAGYDLHRSNTSGFVPSAATLVASTAALSVPDVPPAGTWYYRVVARDAQGNESPTSGQLTVTL
jgi:hypothetical protein